MNRNMELIADVFSDQVNFEVLALIDDLELEFC